MAHSLARSVGIEGAAEAVAAHRGYFERVLSRCRATLVRRWPTVIRYAVVARDDLLANDAAIAEAEARAAYWEGRAESQAAAIERLEERIQDQQRVVIDLRSRLVCLQGKLATTAATARYQSFTSALEARAELS